MQKNLEALKCDNVVSFYSSVSQEGVCALLGRLLLDGVMIFSKKNRHLYCILIFQLLNIFDIGNSFDTSFKIVYSLIIPLIAVGNYAHQKLMISSVTKKSCPFLYSDHCIEMEKPFGAASSILFVPKKIDILYVQEVVHFIQ